VNARAVLLWSAAALAVALVTTNPFYRALVVLAGADVLIAHRRPGRDLTGIGRLLAFGALMAVVLNVLLSHAGDHPFLTLPDGLPGIGGPWTVESVVYGLDAALGLTAAMLAVAPLAYVLEPHELVDALPARLDRTGIALAAALNLVPGIGRSFHEVREAQTMRGWRPTGVRAWSDVLVPVALTSIEGSMDLAEAMEARAFGSGPRTRYAPAGWRRRDVAIAVAAIGALGLVIVARVLGGAADWYPYPVVTLPAIEPAMIAACLLLSPPAWP
jgi:energy-coupling factor transport system permease protein